jgi:chromosome segregation ATPase
MIDVDVQAALTDIRAHIQRDYEAAQDRLTAFYTALNHVSVRTDLAQGQLDSVADQADRLDGAQTDLESRLLDLEDKITDQTRFNDLVITYAESQNREIDRLRQRIEEMARLLAATDQRLAGLDAAPRSWRKHYPESP